MMNVSTKRRIFVLVVELSKIYFGNKFIERLLLSARDEQKDSFSFSFEGTKLFFNERVSFYKSNYMFQYLEIQSL